MFWIGLAVSALAFLLEFDPFRKWTESKWPKTAGMRRHVAVAVLFALGIAVQVYSYRADSQLLGALGRRAIPEWTTRIFEAELKPFAGVHVEVRGRPEVEAHEFAVAFARMLTGAGLRVVFEDGRNSIMAPSYGITWWTRDEDSPIAIALRRSFAAAQLDNDPHYVSDLDHDAVFDVGLRAPP